MESAIPVLIQALKDTDSSIGGVAAEALGNIGSPARDAYQI